MYRNVEDEPNTGLLVAIEPPLLICSVPLIVVPVLGVSAPAVVMLLKVNVPLIVPEPRKLKVPAPVPDAKVPEVAVRLCPLAMLTVLLLPTLNVPALSVSVPDMVGLLLRSYCRPLVFKVRLLIAVKLGSVTVLVPVQFNTTLDEELVLRLLTVPEIYGPFKVRVLDPTVNVPLDSVSVPPMFKVLPSVAEPEDVRLSVKFCIVLVVLLV